MSDKWEDKKAKDRDGESWEEGEQYDVTATKDAKNEWKEGDSVLGVEIEVEVEEDTRILEKTPEQWNEYWVKQMEAARKRLRKFHQQGDHVVDEYLDERVGTRSVYSDANKDLTFRLNLFHTNVSTQLAMLYGQTPKVDVSREHADPEDDAARVASSLLQRMLQADVEPSGDGTADILRECLQDRLLPGLGIARVRYEYDTAEEMLKSINPETFEVEEIEQITNERVPADYVNWLDFRWGWCRTWAECPWIAFRNYLSKKEAEARFGEKEAKSLEYKNQLPGDPNEQDEEKDQENVTQKAEIWEIWHKDSRMVFWWAKGQSKPLDILEDPLGLDGFWPIPKPLTSNVTNKLWVPKADYVLAQDLYNQVNTLATRISIITDAIKVVGVYDQSAGGSVGRMLKEGLENDLIPVDNWAMFAEKGGLKGSIDWFPVQDVVATLQTLRQVLNDTIEQLYQVTGMSDILRGANTDQYTSDGTQQLKAKFGSIRIQALQDQFAQFASDLEALKAEVVAKHFQDQSIIEQSGAGFLTQMDQQQIPAALHLIRSPAAKFRIQIRPESVAMIDYAQIKAERTEFLNAMATYIQSAQAMVQQVPGSLPIMMEMLKWGMAGFKGSSTLEGLMDQAIDQAMKAQQQEQQKPEQPSPEQLRVQAEQMRQQTEQIKISGDMQKIAAKAQADMQNLQAKVQGEIAKISADAERDMALEDRQSQYALLEIARELESKLTEIQATFDSTIGVEQEQARLDMAVDQNQHRLKLAEINTQRRNQGPQ